MSHYTNEDGRLIVVQDDTETPVFAEVKGGILHCMVRATDEDTFNAVGLQVGLLAHENPAQDAVVDEDGNVVQEAVAPSGAIVPAKGNTVTRIGPHVITPAVLDEDGNELVPAVVDSRFHANFWIPASSEWEELIVEWANHGTAGASNGSESAVSHQGIELIDPLSVTTPHNVLL